METERKHCVIGHIWSVYLCIYPPTSPKTKILADWRNFCRDPYSQYQDAFKDTYMSVSKSCQTLHYVRQPGGKWVGDPLGAHGWTAGSEAVSAYLMRIRPSGRKINSQACCYCRARGRAATRAQHNIYTAGQTHIHKDTLTLAGTFTCTHALWRANKHWDMYTYTSIERKQVLSNSIWTTQFWLCKQLCGDCRFFVCLWIHAFEFIHCLSKYTCVGPHLVWWGVLKCPFHVVNAE